MALPKDTILVCRQPDFSLQILVWCQPLKYFIWAGMLAALSAYSEGTRFSSDTLSSENIETLELDPKFFLFVGIRYSSLNTAVYRALLSDLSDEGHCSSVPAGYIRGM